MRSFSETVAALAGTEELWAKLDGHRMRYQRAGSGPPLLLIHGLLGYSFSWRFNLATFAEHFTVYAVDLLGTGYSEKPAGLDCSLGAIARRLTRFMDVTGLVSADVIGTSHGGGVAAMMAASEPNRVRRLVLVANINPWSRIGRKRLWALNSPLGWPVLKLGWPVVRAFKGPYLARMYGDKRRISPGTIEGYVAPLKARGSDRYPMSVVRNWRKDTSPLREAFGKIKAPTLVLWGSKDKLVSPSSATAVQQAIQGAELKIIEGAGHLVYEELPEEFNRVVLDFFQRHPL